MTDPQITARQLFVLVATIALVNVVLAPAIPMLFGKSYLDGVLAHTIAYVALALICVAGWFIGIKVLHLNARGPVPWYASPVVWLSPLFVLTLTIMFGGD